MVVIPSIYSTERCSRCWTRIPGKVISPAESHNLKLKKEN